MALIYLRHPVHGVKIATLHLEAEYDEQHGWEQYDPNELTQNNVNSLSPKRKRAVVPNVKFET